MIEKIIYFCNQHSKAAEVLQEAIDWESNQTPDNMKLGWEWSDVRGPSHLLRSLVIDGIIDMSYSSRSSKHYKLHDREATIEALALWKDQSEAQTTKEVSIPPDLFDPIVGYEDVKHWFKKSLSSPKPVHIVLVGPPASAKSLFMMEIARIPGSAYYSGAAASKAGIQRFLADTKPPLLIIDEIDKMDERDQAALYMVMESGLVTELKVGRTRTEVVPVRIYAAGNTDATLGDALRSRFLSFRFRSYTMEEYVQVVINVLTKRESKDKELAMYIANKLSLLSRDPRDAVQVARLCESVQEVDTLVSTLRRYT